MRGGERRQCPAMSCDKELIALIDLIYDAVLDTELSPAVLTKLADSAGASQVAMPSFDWQTKVFSTIAPRFDPDILATYKDYWAFHEPIVPRAALRPADQIYSLDSLIPREEFAATPVFDEFWRPAGCGLAAMGRQFGRGRPVLGIDQRFQRTWKGFPDVRTSAPLRSSTSAHHSGCAHNSPAQGFGDQGYSSAREVRGFAARCIADRRLREASPG